MCSHLSLVVHTSYLLVGCDATSRTIDYDLRLRPLVSGETAADVFLSFLEYYGVEYNNPGKSRN